MIVVVMGVSGAGKTTIGRGLAGRLGAAFVEGDDFHPATSVEKMRRGQPLTDADREPWLADLAHLAGDLAPGDRHVVLACSALKQSYRDILAAAGPGRVRFVYLKAAPDLIRARMQARTGHFMPASLIESQFADLEEPPLAIVIDAAERPEQILDEIEAELARQGLMGNADKKVE
jgi:gluconokinase